MFVRLAPGTSRHAAEQQLTQATPTVPRRRRPLHPAGQERRCRPCATASSHCSTRCSCSSSACPCSASSNTSTLSLHERTREFGMLRAPWMTPEQTRVLIRDESIITAVALGAVAGVVLGVLLDGDQDPGACGTGRCSHSRSFRCWDCSCSGSSPGWSRPCFLHAERSASTCSMRSRRSSGVP